MSHIIYTATISTMGEADDDYANRYVAALEAALRDNFPDAEVTVDRDDRQSSSSMRVSTDINTDDVHAIANRVWNASEF